ncbi:MAG: transposase [Chthoniobacter sp.]|nr:transposase [Chthoniobacter sp.]
MPRSVRLEYPGAFYHVMARGYRRERIFADDVDRRFFLQTLGEACERTGWRVHAWVLMRDHYHCLLETPEPNLVAGMQWLQNAYTRRFNTRHGTGKRLFGDRYKAVVTEGRRGDYYRTLLDYIHLNPVRAGLIDVKGGQSVRDYAWSSVAAGYALAARQRPAWLACEEGLGAYDLADDAASRRRFVAHLDERARTEAVRKCGVPAPQEDRRRSDLRQGWYWGSQGFAGKMLALAVRVTEGKKARHRTSRRGPVAKAHGEKTAEALVRAGLAETGLADENLETLPGSDPRKVRIARAVWDQTTVPLAWIAERLEMRSAANVSQILRRARGVQAPSQIGRQARSSR